MPFSLLVGAAYIDLAGIDFWAEPQLIVSVLVAIFLAMLLTWSGVYWGMARAISRAAPAFEKGELSSEETLAVAKKSWRLSRYFPWFFSFTWFLRYVLATQVWLRVFPERVPTTLSVGTGTAIFSAALFVGGVGICAPVVHAHLPAIHNAFGARLALDGVTFPTRSSSLKRKLVWLALAFVVAPTLWLSSVAYVRHIDSFQSAAELALGGVLLTASEPEQDKAVPRPYDLREVSIEGSGGEPVPAIVFTTNARELSRQMPALANFDASFPLFRRRLEQALLEGTSGTLINAPSQTLLKYRPTPSGELLVAAMRFPALGGHSFLFAFIAFLIVVIAWAPISAFYAGHSISAPIVRTRSTMRRIMKTGKLTEAVLDYRDDELGDLFEEFRTLLKTKRDTEQLYRLLAENVSDVIWAADEELRLTYLSPSFERLTGLVPPDLGQLLLEETLSSASRSQLLEKLRGAITRVNKGNEDSAHIPAEEVELLTEDGCGVWVEISARVVRHNADGISVIGVTRDIEARRRLEHQLRQSQKLEALGTLAGGVAHDFNNNLQVIISTASLMRRKKELSDSMLEMVEMIESAGEKSAALTRQLLTFSRKQDVKLQKVELDETVAGIAELLDPVLGEDIHLEIETAEASTLVECDPPQMEQVIMNLVVNARDAMPTGGSLTIRTSMRELSAGESTLLPGRYVELEVTDTGMGMDEKTREHIFEPFFTTKGLEHGTGLGLSTVYGIIMKLGGELLVESTPGAGTTMRALLPAAAGEATLALSEQGVKPNVLVGTTVLLVEDEASVRATVKSMLEAGGCKVLVADSGANALAVLDAESCDLIVTDVVMNGMNGRELSEALWKKKPDAKILFVSGYSENVMGRHGIIPEEIHFLAKPFTIDALLGKLAEVLAS